MHGAGSLVWMTVHSAAGMSSLIVWPYMCVQVFLGNFGHFTIHYGIYWLWFCVTCSAMIWNLRLPTILWLSAMEACYIRWDTLYCVWEQESWALPCKICMLLWWVYCCLKNKISYNGWNSISAMIYVVHYTVLVWMLYIINTILYNV